MELVTLKSLRFITPGILLYGLLVILCFTTTWCELAMPKSIEEISKLIASILLGLLYSFLPFRKWSNSKFHIDVNDNIVARLTKPFLSENEKLAHLGWNDVKNIFYRHVDNDETLKMKSKLVMFNGYIWTSVADLRAVSVIGILIFALSALCSKYVGIGTFEETRVVVPIVLLLVLFVISIPASLLVTKRHTELSDEQCDFMLEHYEDELRTQLLAKL